MKLSVSDRVTFSAISSATLLVLSGCAEMPSMPKLPDSVALPSLKPTPPLKVGMVPPAPEHKWMSVEDDLKENRALGDGLIPIPKLEEYLNGLYAKLKTSAGVPAWPGKVYIVADTSLNAHSSPSGNLYINLALIQSADSEDEIFAVLSHEFAHVYLNHQMAHDSAFLAGTAGAAGKYIATFLDSDKNPTGWRAADGIGLVQDVTSNFIMPSWQRSTEEEADKLGATLSLKNNYSYPSGFKAFLERLAPVESDDVSKKKAQQKADMDMFTRTGSFQGAKAAPADKKMADEIKSEMSRLVLSMPKQAIKNHEDAVAREQLLTAEVMPILTGGPRAKPRKAEWDAARKEKTTAAILQNYALLNTVDNALAEKNYKQAYAQAQKAASGPTKDHGMPVVRMYHVMSEAGIGTPKQRLDVLLRNFDSTYPAWSVQKATAALIGQTDEKKGLEYLMKAQQMFGYPQGTFPDVILALAEKNDVKNATEVSRMCIEKAPRMAIICMGNTKTAAEKKEAQAKDEQHQERLGENLKTRLFGN